MTTWVEIPEYPGYAVSDDGRVRSPSRILATSLRNRYPSVVLYDKGAPRRFGVHVLVLTAFKGPRPPGLQACHKDDVPTNNVLSNLFWGTVAQNLAQRKTARGERAGQAKLTEDQVRYIRGSSLTKSQLARKFGVTPGTVGKIVAGSTWSHL